MTYVEVFRARRVLFWFTLGIAAILALALSGIVRSQPHSEMTSGIPVTWLLGIAVLGPLVVGSCLAGSLSAEGTTLAILWTRPVLRTSIAWQYTAVDLVAMVISYVVVLLAEIVIIAALGFFQYIRGDSGAAVIVALAFACSLMLYAYIRLLSGRLTGRGGIIAGVLWAAMFIIGALSQAPFPEPIHSILIGLDWLSPLSWLGNIGSEAHTGHTQLIPLSDEWRALVAGVVSIIVLVASVPWWATREA
ncbi:MAG: hypothetical protein ABR975_12445 [Vulcanimicrobiaceae bacterium]|jgi:hypothetical protein